MVYVLRLAAIAAEVVATSSLPRTQGFTLLVPSIVAVAGYTLAAFLLALVVRSMPVGVAYAIWAGLGVALVAVLGRFLFDDPLTWVTGAGIATMVGGVVLVEVSTAAR